MHSLATNRMLAGDHVTAPQRRPASLSLSLFFSRPLVSETTMDSNTNSRGRHYELSIQRLHRVTIHHGTKLKTHSQPLYICVLNYEWYDNNNPKYYKLQKGDGA